MAGGLPSFFVFIFFLFLEILIDLMRIKVYNEIVSNMSSVTSREATLWQDSFLLLIQQLVFVPHPDTSNHSQYVPRCDNAIMQQPKIAIVLIIIPTLLNPYLHRVPACTAGLTPAATNLALEARPVSDINYRAIGATAGRTLATFCIPHVASLSLLCSLFAYSIRYS